MLNFQQESKANAVILSTSNQVAFFRKEHSQDDSSFREIWMEIQEKDADHFSMVGLKNVETPTYFENLQTGEVIKTGNPKIWCFYPDYVLASAAKQAKILPIEVAVTKIFSMAIEKDIGRCLGTGSFAYILCMSEVADLLNVSMFNKNFRAAFLHAARKFNVVGETYDKCHPSYDFKAYIC